MSENLDNELLRHTYISGIIKALAIFCVPFLAITVHFNMIQDYRPLPLYTLSSVLLSICGLYVFRHRFCATTLSIVIAILGLIAASIHCVVNQSIAYAGVSALITIFAISIVDSMRLHLAVIVLTQVSLYMCYTLFVDANAAVTDLRWLVVILVGQLVILTGLRIVFAHMDKMFKTEHDLRLKSEAAAREKSRFLANMSHEIRTPIAGVVGSLDLVNPNLLDDSQAEKVNIAKQSANILLNIVNDILDYSKIQAGKLQLHPTEFNLKHLLSETCNVIEPLINARKNQLQISHDWQSEIWVKADKTRLQQVLLNLLSNANKFTSAGQIEIHAKAIENNGKIDFECTVSDTGIGISDDDLATLFKAFKQVDNSASRKTQGTGLGLLICKQILQLMDGEISVQSEKNKGSEFTFSLQLERAEPVSEEAEQGDDKPLNTLSVLVVEDNEINQIIINDLLVNIGINVTLADNGQSALRTLKVSEPSAFDCIFMDCQMPIMDGFEATARIREGEAGKTWIETPIIALTANTLEGDREACIAAGMTHYLAKPIEQQKLLYFLRGLNA